MGTLLRMAQDFYLECFDADDYAVWEYRYHQFPAHQREVIDVLVNALMGLHLKVIANL